MIDASYLSSLLHITGKRWSFLEYIKSVVNDDIIAGFWRWIAPALPGRIYGGSDTVNLKLDFMVFG